ncbi:hypothetical protein Y032_0091g2425 [Ancylostoma ceylanicum]|uniref:Uncharacterized protein n=1 Tax=Ancylostoma ceylanicum TaxID=53326 RepID=A0A016TM50_9BILA|nr:hypothetical protein Y032_0091g2425 [Ancylostoma ceylanicum]
MAEGPFLQHLLRVSFTGKDERRKSSKKRSSGECAGLKIMQTEDGLDQEQSTIVAFEIDYNSGYRSEDEASLL